MNEPEPIHPLQTDEALQRAQLIYYRALTELASEVVAVLAADAVVRYVSPAVIRVLGYDPNELVGRSVLGLLEPQDVLVAQDTLEHLRVDPNWVAKLEVRIRHRDGSWRTLEVVGQNLLQDPSAAGIIVSARDITERKQAQARIFEQAALLENARDAIIVCDLESRVLFWNRSAERIYGWSAQEAVGKNTDALLLGATGDRPISAFKGLIAKGEWSGQLIQMHRNGQEVAVESRWSLVRDDLGEPKSILIINTDVTETRKLQAQFLRAQRMESIGALAGGIAHDLNNILAPILIAAELLQETVTNPECREWLKTLSDSAHRGADLVRQILSFARGTGEEVTDLQVRHLVREHEKMLRETLPRSIRLHVAIPDNLWAVQGNATKLSQVLMNLSVNARDALPNGGEIAISARNLRLDASSIPSDADLKPGAYVNISVSDTGIGIPPHLLKRIFEPFFTTKDATKGTGLGLATSLGIVKSHGGALTVVSELGQRTQFDIYLPAVPTQATAPVHAAEQPVPGGCGQCVLVVDDEITSREMTTAILAAHGYQVLTAANGAEGLSAFRSQQDRIALVLTDMAMPVMDGASFIRALRAIRPATRVLVVSGIVEPASLAGLVPDVTMVQKPCTSDTLLLAIHRALGGAA